jgi:acetylornithine deacetylase/succinyl-diaminopimelate desuccinylase-like protein
MKGSLAAFLCALAQEQQSSKVDNLMLLMYGDEEYTFKGIRHFVESEEAAIAPQLMLSLDGELAMATGCRGLIEIGLTSKGKSGHAANPKNGINAIVETVAALQAVTDELAKLDNTGLGQTTTNLATIHGGVLQENGDKTRWLDDANVIPDTAKIVIEIRPASAQVTAKFVLQKIEKALEQRGLRLVDSSVHHDIAPWPAQYDEQALALIKRSYAQAGTPFKLSDRKLQGYIDAQIVVEKIGAPTYIIGTGGENKHGANENVSLADLETATKIYAALLREVLV